eukprot:Skav229400  [mRNA]  locus=scaffold2316:99342:99857:+ [translate_table: standard]
MVYAELMNHLDRALKDEDVEQMKQELGLSNHEIGDMMKIVAKDNNRSDCLFNFGRCLAAVATVLSGVGGIMSNDGNYTTAITLFAWAILGFIIAFVSFFCSSLMRCREEDMDSAARKLNSRFPQLRFTMSKLEAKAGCCGSLEYGWQMAVQRRDGATVTAEVLGGPVVETI